MKYLIPLVVVGSLLATACGRGTTAPDPAYVKEIEAWRQQRVASLTSENGWLTLVGLSWLEPGENRFGSAPGAAVRLPADSGAPADAGTFVLGGDGRVTVRALPGSGVTLDGQPVTERVLRSDAEGQPDVLQVGRLRLYAIRRGVRTGIRVKDPEAATRRDFKGLDYFPIDPSYRVEASFVPYTKPRQVKVPTVVGVEETMTAPGTVHFTLRGKECTLEPLVESPDDSSFFFIFADPTNGKTTYGAGRFLSTPRVYGGTAVLDFNQAFNPPCAFTPFATCPLPTPSNRLSVAVEAGEKAYAGGHH